MDSLRFEKNYSHNDRLRQSFCLLANKIFELELEAWYQKGFWKERYIPYSLFEGDSIAANVSVNKVDLIIEGQRIPSIQIGTVMTHPDYRNKGLSGKLMEIVLDEFDGKYDIMYLFANETVMDFYPKFGFNQVQEADFTISYNGVGLKKGLLRKLNMESDREMAFVADRVARRVPISGKFSTADTSGITMYHCLNGFKEAIFYSDSLDAILIFIKDGTEIDLIDVISSEPLQRERVLQEIAGGDVWTVRFHFMPDGQVQSQESVRQGGLFVRGSGNLEYPEGVKHPLTSEA